MAHDSQDFSSPQEAIEGYLEALLQDVADYDEPEEDKQPNAEPHQAAPEPAAKFVPAAEPDIPGLVDTGDDGGVEDVHPQTDDDGTRVFAPPSARRYARDAATAIRQRQKAAQTEASRTETSFQESPAVVMPELKVAEPEVRVKTESVTETKTDIETPQPDVAEAEPVTETVEAVKMSEPEPVVAEPTAKVETETDTAQQTEALVQENEGWSNGRPDWAQGRFECLLFDVKGLKLAVPLAELGGIHKLEKDPTPLFGQPGWFLGIVRTNNMNVGLVDTAQWVMSEHISEDYKPDYRFAIRIHDSEWGLACHEVAEAISLHPDEVKWRTTLGRRPWLAGTVVDHMCALIDVSAFARLLDSDKVPVDLQALMSDEE